MSSTSSTYSTRSPLRTVALVVATAFLLVGIAGFIPGLTTSYSDMQLAGHESGAMLFGIFQVSVLHNIVHLLFGIVGLAVARTASGSRNFLVGGGMVYLVIWLYGLVVGEDSSANIVPVNNADDWLHLGLGAGMVALGLAVPRRVHTPPVGHDATLDAGRYRRTR